MNLDQLRVAWIASPERMAINNSIKLAVESAIKRAMPMLPGFVVDDCVQAVVDKLDEYMAKPVEAQSSSVVIRDRRKKS